MFPMLAATVPVNEIRFPVLASPKLDGIRGMVVDGRLRSRTGQPIPNAHASKLFGRPELSGYDGELIVGSPTSPNALRDTNAALSCSKWRPAITFYVFDNFSAPGPYADRLRTLRASPGVVILEQVLIKNRAQLLAYEAKVLAAGYEGLMLRDPAGVYKNGRSSGCEQGMLKLKRFVDGEAVILEVIATNETGGGRAGALRVRDLATGLEFKIGTGFSNEEREVYWQLRDGAPGLIVKYKSFLVANERGVVYVGTRAPWDMDRRSSAGLK